jgi:hypothetical protein
MESRKSTGVSLGVRFTAAGDELHGPKRGRSGFDPLGGVRSMLDPALTRAMVDAEPRLLAWLRESREHLIQFTMDPMGALREALPGFDSAMLARIAAIRAVAHRAKPDVPGLKIDRFEVAVAAPGKGK